MRAVCPDQEIQYLPQQRRVVLLTRLCARKQRLDALDIQHTRPGTSEPLQMVEELLPERGLKPVSERNVESDLWAKQYIVRYHALESALQQPFLATKGHLDAPWQTQHIVNEIVIQERHANLQARRHGRPVYLLEV